MENGKALLRNVGYERVEITARVVVSYSVSTRIGGAWFRAIANIGLGKVYLI